jgi:hypothetical protein
MLLTLTVICPECETFDILIAISFIDQGCPAVELQNRATNINAATPARKFFIVIPQRNDLKLREGMFCLAV